MIDFLDELGNFKQKNFTFEMQNLFYILQQWTHTTIIHNFLISWKVVYISTITYKRTLNTMLECNSTLTHVTFNKKRKEKETSH